MNIKVCKPEMNQGQILTMIQYLEAVKEEISIKAFKDCITFLIADLKIDLKKLYEGGEING